MKEIWKDVIHYEKLYQVSNRGRVISVEKYIKGRSDSLRLKNKKHLQPSMSSNGYKIVILSKEGKKVCRKVHRLVVLTFIKNPWNKKTVNHINGVKTDNRVENLEWCTQIENIRHYHKNKKLK